MTDREATRRARGLAAVGWMALALCGCAGGVAAPPPTFDLSGGPPRAGTLRAGGAAVAVPEPTAAPPLPTNRILIRTGGQQVAFLADAQWADQLPRVVQARLIEKLDAGGIGAVRPGASVGATLIANIRRFEIDVARQTAIVEIAAQLVDASGAERAARVFVGEAPASHTLPAEAVDALRRALDQTAQQMIGWLRGRV